ncbi:MAG: hypothetical protein EBS06_01650 [Proteobacteria bacterium]|nr:hypothetical protein [Pseudomonadota bacterium]
MTIDTLEVVLATFLGPFSAVAFTLWQENRRSEREKLITKNKIKRDRQLWILRALMAHRNIRLHPDFVTALNLIELDFYDEKEVIKLWQDYRKTLGEDCDEKDSKQMEVFSKKINHNLSAFLKQIGKILGYEMDKLELLNQAYSPRGWEQNELRGQKISKQLIELLENKRSINFNLVNNPLTESLRSSTLPQGESD